MTDPAALLRSIRIALENTRDGDAFRAEVKRLIAEHDTPSLFDFAAQNARAQARAVIDDRDEVQRLIDDAEPD